MITDICFNDPELLGGGDVEWYMASGRSGLTCIEMALKAAGKVDQGRPSPVSRATTRMSNGARTKQHKP
jgi:hypothetical protein